MLRNLFLTFLALFLCACGDRPGLSHLDGDDYSSSGYSWVASDVHVSNSSTYRRFLKDNGVCDVAKINIGWSRCSKWDSAPDIKLTLDGTLPTGGKVYVAAYADSWGYSSTYRHIVLSVEDSNPFKYWNNNQGFAAWTSGSKGTKAWSADVRIKVYGDPDDDTVELELDYRNARMFEGTLVKRSSRHLQSIQPPNVFSSIKAFFQKFYNKIFN